MGKAELLELAERVEKLEGPDTETDRLIHFRVVHPWLAEKAVKWVHAAYEGPTDFLWWDQARLDARGEGYPDNWDPYTASIDAAMSLYIHKPSMVFSCPRKVVADAIRQRCSILGEDLQR